ncbi:MAG: helix-turn-helix domain-containing protein [Janthinobacterium lividum]
MTSETAFPKTAPLVTGHFREGSDYKTWRAHGTEDWLLICTLSGQGRFGFHSGEILTSTGDLTLIRPGTCHDYGVGPDQGKWELLWTHFHPEPAWQPLLAWPEASPGLMRLTLPEPMIRGKIIARFFEVHRLATGALRHREVFAMNALEEVLLWCDTQNPRSEQARLDPRVLAAMDYLGRSLEAPVTLEDLAAFSGLSASRLSHLFRRQSGLTPMQFLEQQRLDRACQLLDFTARSVAAIAAEVGFENPFYFTLRFKRHTGHSPRDYRKR